MSGRRNHPRFAVLNPWDGAVTLMREVVVHSEQNGEVVVITYAPAPVDELMTLDLQGNGTALRINVRVVDSRPVLIDGQVRHRIQLSVVSDGADAPQIVADAGPAFSV